MINMQRIEIFVAVVEAKSFTNAASILGLTKAVVSFNVKQLEKELNTSLLIRNTRKISVTDIGYKFYQRCKQLLIDAEQILYDINIDNNELQGILRITTTPEYGSKFIVPLLSKFSLKYPKLKIQHTSSSKHDDLIAERFDIAIRIGELEDSNYQARKISDFEIIPVSSVKYFEKNLNQSLDIIEKIENLQWITNSRLQNRTHFKCVDLKNNEKVLRIKLPSKITTDSISSSLVFTLNHTGIAFLPTWFIQDELTHGKLINVLPNHQFQKQGVYAIYPQTKYVSEKVRLFINFLTVTL